MFTHEFRIRTTFLPVNVHSALVGALKLPFQDTRRSVPALGICTYFNTLNCVVLQHSDYHFSALLKFIRWTNPVSCHSMNYPCVLSFDELPPYPARSSTYRKEQARAYEVQRVMVYKTNVQRDPQVHVTEIESCRQYETVMYVTISFPAQFITFLATAHMGVSLTLHNLSARLNIMIRSYGNV
jgi:hypothetical protein